MSFGKYIKVRDKLISRGRITPMEAMLYERCYHFYQSQKAKGEYYFVDQLEAALFFRVTRRTMGRMIKNLEAVGLLVRTGQLTHSRNICYVVQDWEQISEQVLLSDAEYAALVQTYVDERGSNRAALVAYMAAQEAPEQVQDEQPQPEDDKTAQNQFESVTEAIPVNGWPEKAVYLWHYDNYGNKPTKEHAKYYRMNLKHEMIKGYLNI